MLAALIGFGVPMFIVYFIIRGVDRSDARDRMREALATNNATLVRATLIGVQHQLSRKQVKDVENWLALKTIE